MRVFRSVVQPFVLPMLHAWQDFTFGRCITLQFIGDDHAWNVLEPFEQFAEKSFGGVLVASALHEDIKHIAVLVYRSSQIVSLATDHENTSSRCHLSPQFIGVHLPKFQAPLPNRFIGDHDPALCQQFFNIAKAEREAEIQPHRVADDFRWEAESFVIGGSGVCFHTTTLTHCSALLPS